MPQEIGNYSEAELRQIILDTYREVLGNKHFSNDDDFFDNGGDSAKGVQVIHRLRDITGIRLTMSTLYMRRTADELAAEINSGVTG